MQSSTSQPMSMGGQYILQAVFKHRQVHCRARSWFLQPAGRLFAEGTCLSWSGKGLGRQRGCKAGSWERFTRLQKQDAKEHVAECQKKIPASSQPPTCDLSHESEKHLRGKYARPWETMLICVREARWAISKQRADPTHCGISQDWGDGRFTDTFFFFLSFCLF